MLLEFLSNRWVFSGCVKKFDGVNIKAMAAAHLLNQSLYSVKELCLYAINLFASVNGWIFQEFMLVNSLCNGLALNFIRS